MRPQTFSAGALPCRHCEPVLRRCAPAVCRQCNKRVANEQGTGLIAIARAWQGDIAVTLGRGIRASWTLGPPQGFRCLMPVPAPQMLAPVPGGAGRAGGGTAGQWQNPGVPATGRRALARGRARVRVAAGWLCDADPDPDQVQSILGTLSHLRSVVELDSSPPDEPVQPGKIRLSCTVGFDSSSSARPCRECQAGYSRSRSGGSGHSVR